MARPYPNFPLAAVKPVCDTGDVIGTAIRTARIARRLSLQAVADAVGTSPQNVSRIEREKPTTTTLLERVAAAVGIEIVARKVR